MHEENLLIRSNET